VTIFTLGHRLVQDYSHYVQSFLTIQDDRIRRFLELELLEKDRLWPEALLQLNPAYERVATVADLCRSGRLHPLLEQVFYDRARKESLRLYRHQREAIGLALNGEPFIVTSGTGSGKSLTYLLPIFDYVLRHRPEKHRVQAIIVYPMNALVNSQFDALSQWEQGFRERTGQELPVRFKKYTGQELEERPEIQRDPPHILLTNYVMLELMLVRPDERNFVDRAAAELQFLVLDELHTYRGRQGADVSLLVRRLRERCGNPNLLCIGTSATMVAGRGLEAAERRQAVAEFGSRIFGVGVEPRQVVEERLQRVAPSAVIPEAGALRRAVQAPPPETAAELLASPLTAWIEGTFGVYQEPDANLRRRTPITIQRGAEELARVTGLDQALCDQELRAYFLKGIREKLPDDKPIFAFKLHYFGAGAGGLCHPPAAGRPAPHAGGAVLRPGRRGRTTRPVSAGLLPGVRARVLCSAAPR